MRVTLDNSASSQQIGAGLDLLRDETVFMRGSYPGFDAWLTDKVLPGIATGERMMVLEMRDGDLAGFMILKNTAEERKLCTLRVRPLYQGTGVGARMFEHAFEILGTERPLLSVSQVAHPKFQRLFRHFGFEQEAVYPGRYLPAVTEFAYNGLLDAPRRTQLLLPPEPQPAWQAVPQLMEDERRGSGRSGCRWHRSWQHRSTGNPGDRGRGTPVASELSVCRP